MKSTFLFIALLSTCLLAGFAQDKTPTEDWILTLEQRWQDALTTSDISALDKLYDATLIYTHSNGKVDNKSSFISAIKSGATKYQSMERTDIKVTVYDKAAVVTCHWDVHVQARGAKVDLNARYLHVYVQQADGWKLVAHESTKIAP